MMDIDKKYLTLAGIVLFVFVIYKLSRLKKWIFVKPSQKLRKDESGDGSYNATRTGNRKHGGVDILVTQGQKIHAPFNCDVLRIAKPYENGNLSGLEIQNEAGEKVKVFYIQPRADIVGKKMRKGQLIGIAQRVRTHYPNSPGMKDHIHIEKWVNGQNVDPTNNLF